MFIAAALLMWANFIRFGDPGNDLNFPHYGFPISYLIIIDSDEPHILAYQREAIPMNVVFNAGVVLVFGILVERVFRRIWPARSDT